MMSKLNRFGVAVMLFLILLVLLRGNAITFEEVVISVIVGIIAVIAIGFD